MINKDNTQGHSGKTFSRLPITNLDALPKEDIEILEPGILVKGACHQVVARYGSGKTFVSWICARTFLKDGRKVLYLDYENRKSCTKDRLDVIGTTITDRANLLYVSNPNLDLSDDSKKEWVAFLEQEAPDLIVFDSLSGFLANAAVDENSSTGFQRWANVYLQIPKDMGITTLVIDHTGWDGNRSRGTSRKPDHFELLWNVKIVKKFSRTKIGEIQMKETKDRDSLLVHHKLNFVIGGTPFKFEKVKGSDSSEDELSADQKNTLDLIVENSRNENGTQRKNINELFNGSKSKADGTIQSLLEKELIYQDEKSKLYWASDSLDSSVSKSPENLKSPDSNSDSLVNGVKGEGSKGPGPKGPDPKTLSPTEIENLKEYRIEHILDDIDALDYNERGIKVLKAVASFFFHKPFFSALLKSEDDINKILSLVKEEGVEITRYDLAKALKVLTQELFFIEILKHRWEEYAANLHRS